MKTNDLDKLRSTIIPDARAAFGELATRVKSATLYGFALYSDDSLDGIDAAVNTLEQYNRATPGKQFRIVLVYDLLGIRRWRC